MGAPGTHAFAVQRFEREVAEATARLRKSEAAELVAEAELAELLGMRRQTVLAVAARHRRGRQS